MIRLNVLPLALLPAFAATPVFADIPTSLISPLWTTTPDGRHRIGFISDHEGRGQVYSATVGKRAPSSSRISRHTGHDYYARNASSDGTQVVYVAGGELYLLESLEDGVEPQRVDVRLGDDTVEAKKILTSVGKQVAMNAPSSAKKVPAAVSKPARRR